MQPEQIDTALAHYCYQPLEFSKSGALVDERQVDAVGELAGQVTDLLVVSHGWNNTMDQARDLYGELAVRFDELRDTGREPGLADRNLGMVGVLWPSKRFAEADLIPGGAAGLAHQDPVLTAELLAMRGAFSAPGADAALAEAAGLVGELNTSPAARRRYADLLRSLVTHAGDEVSDPDTEFFSMDGAELMDQLDDLNPEDLLEPPGPPGEQGGAMMVPVGAGMPDDPQGYAARINLIGGLLGTGRSMLNYTTFYEMKARAGTIGATALAPVLQDQVIGKTRLHLVGHSFGARLVTAASSSLPTSAAVRSISLLQGAFSHYAFAENWSPGHDGMFRRLVTSSRLAGPMLVTHTRNDTAVGVAYAIASRIAGQVAAAIGDASSRYGGLGSNGAQLTPEAVPGELLDATGDYSLAAGKVYNLLADRFISDHGAVKGPEVAHAILAAVMAT